MPSELHEEQNRAAARWLVKNGFVAGTNVWSSRVRERFDTVGFRASCSVIIESKVSRSDFFADQKKPERSSGGLGNYRFYITPPNLIQIEELPPGWGLLHYDGKRVLEVHKPRGNTWPSPARFDKDWAPFAHCSCSELERSVLYTLLHKLNNNKPILK